MNKIEFKDYPNLTTPLNANNLNQVQTNVETDIASVESDISTINTNATNLNNRVNNLEITRGLPSYIDGYIDCDTTTEYFILTQKNTPNNSFYFVLTFFFESKTATVSRTQIAIPYNYSTGTIKNTVYLRYYIDGALTTWRLVIVKK